MMAGMLSDAQSSRAVLGGLLYRFFGNEIFYSFYYERLFTFGIMHLLWVISGDHLASCHRITDDETNVAFITKRITCFARAWFLINDI